MILCEIPEGWKPIEGAMNHPPGTRWISNGKSRFGGEYKTALIFEDVYYEWLCKQQKEAENERAES
ncbi:MAG: hypothetical protein IKF59_04375 [Lachnospiraceae bacterium]|nr:hypothetical protein [Lachnospiraceae bacterium]